MDLRWGEVARVERFAMKGWGSESGTIRYEGIEG